MQHSSLLTTLAATAVLTASAPAQTNGDHDYNWASLAGGPPQLLVGPGLFTSFGGGDDAIALGDSIRLCYSIDVTQGGRNYQGDDGSQGRTYVSHFALLQGFGGANPEPGVKVGPVSIMARTSTSLFDDACMSDIFLPFGQTFLDRAEDINFGEAGLIPGTAGYSVNQGFFWQIGFEILGQTLPSVPNRLGSDPAPTLGEAPMLTHLVYEIQGPSDGAENPQYFLASTSESNGIAPAGGVTNGYAPTFGQGVWGSGAALTGTVTGSRYILADGSSGTPQVKGGGPLGLALAGVPNHRAEWLGAVALQTPYLVGVRDGNAGRSGADWVVSGGALSTIDVRVVDKLAGAQAPGSGSSVENPNLVLNNAFLLWSATPAATMTQRPFSWDDLGGLLPPRPGSYVIPAQTTARAGVQATGVNLDPVTGAFLHTGLSLLSPFTPSPGPTGPGSDYAELIPTAGVSSFVGGPLTLSTPIPAASGLRLGLHSIGLQVDPSEGGVLLPTETSNTLTAVLQ